MKSKIFLIVTGVAIAIGFNVKKAQAEVYSQAGIELEQNAGKNLPKDTKNRHKYKPYSYLEALKIKMADFRYFMEYGSISNSIRNGIGNLKDDSLELERIKRRIISNFGSETQLRSIIDRYAHSNVDKTASKEKDSDDEIVATK
jgi:hypothetical protein